MRLPPKGAWTGTLKNKPSQSLVGTSGKGAFVEWSRRNGPLLNVSKTKGIAVDFHRKDYVD